MTARYFHDCTASPWPPPTGRPTHAHLIGGPAHGMIAEIVGVSTIVHVGPRTVQYVWRYTNVGEIVGACQGPVPFDDPLGWRRTRGRLLR